MKKIQITKEYHQVETTMANQHNTLLGKKNQAEAIINSNLSELQVDSGFIDWFIRTIGDELYRLQFLYQSEKEQPFYRIRQFYNEKDENLKKENDFYIEQFKDFDMEDYLDVLIFPKIEETNEQNTDLKYKIDLRIRTNAFTYLLQDQQQLKQLENNSKDDTLAMFVEHKITIDNNSSTKLGLLVNYVSFLLKNFVFRSENSKDLKNKLLQSMKDEKELFRRFKPILDEEVRIMLYEIYREIIEKQ